jgi:hypothetical protein
VDETDRTETGIERATALLREGAAHYLLGVASLTGSERPTNGLDRGRPPDWPISIMSYGGGRLARFPVRKRKKRLAKKIARRGYFRHHNNFARYAAWEESQMVEGRLQALAWAPQPGTLGEFYGRG